MPLKQWMTPPIAAASSSRKIRQQVRVRVAAVDHERQPGAAGLADEAAEMALLHLGRRMLVVVVEPGLPDRDDLRMRPQAAELVPGVVGDVARVVGMDRDRGEDVGIGVGDRDRRVVARERPAGADRDHAADAGGAGAGDHRVAVGRERRLVEVAMGVDQRHDRCRWCQVERARPRRDAAVVVGRRHRRRRQSSMRGKSGTGFCTT